MFVPDKPFQCLRVRQEHTQVKHLSGATIQVRLLALPSNIRLDWNGLLGTNTLAYYEHSEITDVKSFITSATRPNFIKLFLSVVYKFSKYASVC